MSLWIVFTLIAAVAQNVRFMLQKQLKGIGLSTSGATFARFLWAAPVVTLFVLVWSGGELPSLTPAFWAFAIAGGAAQIVATLLVVALFSYRNFTVGITLIKTEVFLTALTDDGVRK